MKSARVATIALALPLTLVVAAAPSPAQAQQGYAVNHFDPSEKGSDWFANESLDFRGQLRPAIGVLADYSSDQVVFYNFDGSKRGALVSSQFYLHAGASLTLVDRIRIGVSAPFALYQNGQSTDYLVGPTPSGTTFHPPTQASTGDIRVGADLRLVGEYKDPFTLAVGAQVHLPSGDTNQYTGDGSASVTPRIMVAGQLGPVAYAGRFGYEVSGRRDTFAGMQLGDQLVWGASVGIWAFDHHLILGPEMFGQTLATKPRTNNSPTELLFGAHLVEGDFRFGLGAGGGLGEAYSSPGFRLLGGIEWTPAIPEPKPSDRDGDGIIDTEDACPDVPGLKTDDPKTNGCPAPAPADRDGDGVLDKDDACPDVAGVKTDDPKTNGCPADKDGDGIYDKDDACPDVPGVKTDDPKTNGCPPDKDGDGIADKDDACPDVAGVKTDDPKTNGCPPDRDGDGIADKDDACPDQPGVQDPDPKKNGCPALAHIENGMIKISEQVQFKTGSAQILAASDELMNAVYGILKDHPEIKLVHIEGHTDNKGSAAGNKTLSDKRAKAVMNWLAMKGIEKSRMDAKGYGQERPIDSNSTEEGRQKNRRVEFHIDDKGSDKGTEKPAGDKAAPTKP